MYKLSSDLYVKVSGLNGRATVTFQKLYTRQGTLYPKSYPLSMSVDGWNTLVQRVEHIDKVIDENVAGKERRFHVDGDLYLSCNELDGKWYVHLRKWYRVPGKKKGKHFARRDDDEEPPVPELRPTPTGYTLDSVSWAMLRNHMFRIYDAIDEFYDATRMASESDEEMDDGLDETGLVNDNGCERDHASAKQPRCLFPSDTKEKFVEEEEGSQQIKESSSIYTIRSKDRELSSTETQYLRETPLRSSNTTLSELYSEYSASPDSSDDVTVTSFNNCTNFHIGDTMESHVVIETE